MDYKTAKTLIATYKPDFLVDDANPDFPAMFVVRRTKAGHPFSIHLPDSRGRETIDPEIEAKEFMHMLDAAETSLPPIKTSPSAASS